MYRTSAAGDARATQVQADILAHIGGLVDARGRSSATVRLEETVEASLEALTRLAAAVEAEAAACDGLFMAATRP